MAINADSAAAAALAVKVTADFGPLRKDLEQTRAEAGKALGGMFDDASSDGKKFADDTRSNLRQIFDGVKADGLGSIFDPANAAAQDFGRNLTAGVSLPLAGVGIAATKFASDLGEVQSKVSVVFGEAAGDVEAFAAEAATAYGLSERAALEYSGTLGAIFTAQGLGADAAADLSTSLVGLASDFASFNNLAPEEAFGKLRAGILGESEPLKDLGIAFNAAAVDAKALEMGLGGVSGELTEAEKIQARYALIMEQSTTAQGDFARTSDSAANQARIMAAQAEEAAAAFGELILPIATVALTIGNDLLGAVTNLPGPLKAAVTVFGGLVAAAGPAILIGAKMASAWRAVQSLQVAAKLQGWVSSIFALNPVVGVAVAAAGALFAVWQSGRNKAAELRQNVSELTGAIIAQNGALDTSGDRWSKYFFEQSAFAKNQIDDFERIGASAQDVQDAMLGDGEALRDLLQAADDVGEIDLSKGMRELLDTTDDVPAAFGRISEAGVRGGEGVTGNIGLLVSLAKEMETTATTAEDALTRLKVDSDLVSPEALARIDELELKGFNATEIMKILAEEGLHVAESVGQVDGSAIDETATAADGATTALAGLSEEAAKALGAVNELGQIEVGGFRLALPEGITDEGAQEIGALIDEYKKYAEQNEVPLDVVVQFGPDALDKLRGDVEGAIGPVSEAFGSAFVVDPEKVDASMDAVLGAVRKRVEAEAKYSSNITDLYAEGYGELAEFIQQQDPKVAAQLAAQAANAGRAEREAWAAEVGEFDRLQEGAEADRIRAQVENAGEWEQVGLAQGEAYQVGLEALAGTTDQVMSAELEAAGLAVDRAGRVVTPRVEGFAGAISGALGRGLSGSLSESIDFGLAGVESSVAAGFGAMGGTFAVAGSEGGRTIGESFGSAGVASMSEAVSAVAGPIAGAGTVLAAPAQASGDQTAGAFRGALVGGILAAAGEGVAAAGTGLYTLGGVAAGATNIAGAAAATAFGQSLAAMRPEAEKEAVTAAQGIDAQSPTVSGAASRLGQGATAAFGAGVSGMSGQMTESLGRVSWAFNASGLASEASEAGRSIGSNFGSGVAAGIASAIPRIEIEARGSMASAMAAARRAADIRSPSRKAAALVGRPWSEGVAVGIVDAQGEVVDAGAAIMGDLEDTMSGLAAGIGERFKFGFKPELFEARGGSTAAPSTSSTVAPSSPTPSASSRVESSGGRPINIAGDVIVQVAGGPQAVEDFRVELDRLENSRS